MTSAVGVKRLVGMTVKTLVLHLAMVVVMSVAGIRRQTTLIPILIPVQIAQTRVRTHVRTPIPTQEDALTAL